MSKYSKFTFKTESPTVAIANPVTVSGHRLPWLGHSRFLKVAPSDKSGGRPIFVLPFKTRGAISPAGCNLYQEWGLGREGDIGAGSADDSGFNCSNCRGAIDPRRGRERPETWVLFLLPLSGGGGAVILDSAILTSEGKDREKLAGFALQ